MTGAVQVFVWLGIIYFTLQITSFVLREISTYRLKMLRKISAYQLKKSIRETMMQRMRDKDDPE